MKVLNKKFQKRLIEHNYSNKQQKLSAPHYGIASPTFKVACWWCLMLIILNLANFTLCNKSSNNNNQNGKYLNDSLVEARQLFEDATGSIWSQYLENYVLSQSTTTSPSRTSKDLPIINNYNEMPIMTTTNHHSHPMLNTNPYMSGSQNQQQLQQPLNYHSSAYKRPPGAFITKRIGEAVELEPHMRPPIINPQFRPMTNQMLQQQHHQQVAQQQQQQHQPGFFQQLFGFGGGGGGGGASQQQTPIQPQQQLPQQPLPTRPGPLQHNGPPQPFRAVTENDLYLLGAIEKLVYRVDYLESRIRRSEQLIYYLMAGNQNQKEVRDPCPTNFTRINENCYFINSHEQVNWKSANTACKSLGAHLAEFEKVSENEEIMAYLLNQPSHRGRDFWLGALNPGLLWIWSNSAKPVNPNMNLTSIAMSHDKNITDSNLIDGNVHNETKTDASNASESILNNTVEIKGQGRCLRLSYNPKKHSYMYYGQECTSRHHFICEHEDKTLDNRIQKIARDLELE